MDLFCNRCGEPWDLYHVMHDAEEGDFVRDGGNIKKCPACMNKSDEQIEKETPQEVKDKNLYRSEIASLLGDDVDGCAAMFEDFGLD